MKKYIPNKRITTQLYKWHISSYKWVMHTIVCIYIQDVWIFGFKNLCPLTKLAAMDVHLPQIWRQYKWVLIHTQTGQFEDLWAK